MPRSIFLGRPWPAPGEPLFLPDDIDGALELQRDEDGSCPRGHHLDETVGDDGPAISVVPVVCHACAAEDSARREADAAVRNGPKDEDGHPLGADLLDGRYHVAVIDHDQPGGVTA